MDWSYERDPDHCWPRVIHVDRAFWQDARDGDGWGLAVAMAGLAPPTPRTAVVRSELSRYGRTRQMVTAGNVDEHPHPWSRTVHGIEQIAPQ